MALDAGIPAVPCLISEQYIVHISLGIIAEGVIVIWGRIQGPGMCTWQCLHRPSDGAWRFVMVAEQLRENGEGKTPTRSLVLVVR